MPASSEAVRAPYCNDFYPTVCQGADHSDPTGSVLTDIEGEVQALRVYEQVIHQHPDWEGEQIDEELVNVVYAPEKRSRLIGAFEYAREGLVSFIEHQPNATFTRAEKRTIKSRLRAVKLELPPPPKLYADELELLTKNDVYYERLNDGTMRLRVGGAYIYTATSWFNMVFTFSHELAHSIDPCEIRAGARMDFPAYDRLKACFLDTNLIAARRTRQECVQDDQLSETFADWMAVQVTARALGQFATEFDQYQLLHAAANSVKDLCDQDEGLSEVDLTFHPSPETRIQRIFGNNPRIREVLGCRETPTQDAYCSFDWAK